MISREFKNIQLLKKARFKVTVNRISKSLGVKPPEVFFGDCSSRRNEEAHIHTDEKLICVSDDKLEQMSYEDIEETASHEVNHLLDKCDESNPCHSSGFYKRHNNLKVATWRPPVGVGVTHYDGRKFRKIDYKLKEIDPDECLFSNCSNKSELNNCPACKQKYCEVHVKPFEPGDSIHVRLNPKRDHACADHFDYVQKKKAEEDKIYKQKLAAVIRKNSKNWFNKPNINEYKPKENLIKRQDFNIVDRPKNYKEPEQVYVKSKESILEKLKNKIKSLF